MASKRTPITSMRIDPQLKSDAQKIFDELHITMTAAVSMFLAEVVRTGGLPLQMKIDMNGDAEERNE